MKLFITCAGGLLLAAAGVASASCNADNCARAVTGTFRQMTLSHYADCQSFMACTVTPPATTVTSTVTVTPPVVVSAVTGGSYPENVKRDINGRAPIGAITNCPAAVPTYASACSGTVRYSSACSCFGVAKTTTTAPTPTVTTTVTTTLPTQVSVTTVQPSVPTLCDNAGLQWAAFPNDYYPDYTMDQEQSYDPATHKRDMPQLTGVTDYLYFASPKKAVYGQSINPNYFNLEHRGYLFAPETGTYNFTADTVDNGLYMWIGSAAYSGWSKANAQQQILYYIPTHTYSAGTYSMDLVAGTYYPFRVVYWQGSGGGYFNYKVTAPSGYTLIGSDSSKAHDSPFVVQYSCDGVLAPQYPPFGQET